MAFGLDFFFFLFETAAVFFLDKVFALSGLALLNEFFYPALSVNVFHFAGKERVAGRANVNVDLLLGGTGDKGSATGAGHLGIVVKFEVSSFLVFGVAHEGYFNTKSKKG